jgi:hypothetical protein
MLRIKALTDTVQAQSTKLAEWNAKLEERVNEQLGQLEKLSQLKRFFSSQHAEAILTGGADNPLVVIAAKSPWFFLICVTSRLLLKPPTPKKSCGFCANSTPRWAS